MLIRAEGEKDWTAVHAVNASAFETPAEAGLVDALREQAHPVVSPVAEDNGVVVGHIMFSPVIPDNGKAYGELETGATRLAFASLELAKTNLKQEVVAASPDRAPLGVEIALVTPDVPALYARAMKAGATAVSEPAAKPWGQTVAYVRDKAGHLVELCTPLP